MANMVCGGAVCRCSFGMTPSVLLVTPENRVSSTMAFAVVTDNVPIKNIMPFGMCRNPANPTVAAATAAAMGVLTPMPCVPVPAGTWQPGSSNVKIAGKPALTSDSKLTCAYGGTIQLDSPGIFTVFTG